MLLLFKKRGLYAAAIKATNTHTAADDNDADAVHVANNTDAADVTAAVVDDDADDDADDAADANNTDAAADADAQYIRRSVAWLVPRSLLCQYIRWSVARLVAQSLLCQYNRCSV